MPHILLVCENFLYCFCQNHMFFFHFTFCCNVSGVSSGDTVTFSWYNFPGIYTCIYNEQYIRFLFLLFFMTASCILIPYIPAPPYFGSGCMFIIFLSHFFTNSGSRIDKILLILYNQHFLPKFPRFFPTGNFVFFIQKHCFYTFIFCFLSIP